MSLIELLYSLDSEIATLKQAGALLADDGFARSRAGLSGETPPVQRRSTDEDRSRTAEQMGEPEKSC